MKGKGYTRELCERELRFLEQLPQAEVPAAAPEAEPPVEEIEEHVMAAFSPQEVEQPAEPETPDYPEGDPFAPEDDLEATRRINLDELKFGRNYSGEK